MAIFQCASGLVLPSSFHLLLCSDCAWLQEEREFGNKGVQEERGEQGVGEVERERRAKSVWQQVANYSFTMYNQIQTSKQNDALGSQNELKERKEKH